MKTNKKVLLDFVPKKEQVIALESWLKSSESREKIIEVQNSQQDVSRIIREMNNYNPSLLTKPFTI